jgi:hypothetical protein
MKSNHAVEMEISASRLPGLLFSADAADNKTSITNKSLYGILIRIETK